MKFFDWKILHCRRTVIALFSIACLTAIALFIKTDISGIAVAIAGIASANSAANAWQNKGVKPEDKP